MSNPPSYEEIAKWTVADLDRETLSARRRDEPDALTRIAFHVDQKIFDTAKFWKNDKTRRLDEKVGELLSREEYLKCVAPDFDDEIPFGR